jgi:hypothetical protein
MTNERGPIEDDITDEKKQDASPDLPAQVEGNDDEDDTSGWVIENNTIEPVDLGEPDTEGDTDG